MSMLAVVIDEIQVCLYGTGCTRTAALNSVWNVGKLRSGLFCDRAACRLEAGVAGIYKRKADRPPSPPPDISLRRTNYAAPLQQQTSHLQSRLLPSHAPQPRPHIPAKQPRPLAAGLPSNAASAASIATVSTSDPAITTSAVSSSNEQLPTSTAQPVTAAPNRAAAVIACVVAPPSASILPQLLFTIGVAFTGMHGRDPTESELEAQVERCLGIATGDVRRFRASAFDAARAAAAALHAERAIALRKDEQRTHERVLAALKGMKKNAEGRARHALQSRNVNVRSFYSCDRVRVCRYIKRDSSLVRAPVLLCCCFNWQCQ